VGVEREHPFKSAPIAPMRGAARPIPPVGFVTPACVGRSRFWPGGCRVCPGGTVRLTRNWFSWVITKAARRESGSRDYGEKDIHTLRFIRRARDLGFPIEEIASCWRSGRIVAERART